MALPLPQSIDALSAEWLDEILRSSGVIDARRVVRIEKRLIGEGIGFLSRVALVTLHYDGAPGDAPASLVVKLEPEEKKFRDTERESGAFQREIDFYGDVASRVDMRLARVYHTQADAEGSVLVMEDLSHLSSVDQIRGMRHGEVIAVVRQIARLHAAFWNNEALQSLRWAPDHDLFWPQAYREDWPAFAREYEVRIGREGMRLGEAVAENLDWLQARIAARPTSLIHSDLRADNILFGDPGTPEAAVIVDWQLANKNLAAIDPTRLLGGSEPAAERQGHHLEVFTAWHETLLSCSVRDYDFEQALDDFRLGALYGLLVPVKAHAYVAEATSDRLARLCDAVTERMFVSAVELDAGNVLP